MTNFFDKHERDPDTISDTDIEEAQDDRNTVWSYPGEHDLSIKQPYQESVVDGLDHVSKSRIKTAMNCWREFGMKYMGEVREGDNYYFSRGTAVHDSFEAFHLNLKAFIAANDQPPERFTTLMPPGKDWFQWIEYIGPFFEWELERWEAALDATENEEEALSVWEPHSIEEELRVEDPPVGTLDWMGPYDVLHHAASIPQVEETEGYVVVDYKTGSVKDKEAYKEEGIYIDLEFYGWMLEELDFDVVAGIGMYPTEDRNVVRRFPNEDIREDIAEVIEHLHSAEPTVEDFPISEGPLCDWCFYQDQCPSEW